MSENSFQKGWEMLRIIDHKAVKAKIMEAFAITTPQAFNHRKSGKSMGKPADKEVIERIFAAHGVDKSDVWGDTLLKK